MIQKVQAPISVAFVYNHKTRSSKPVKVIWEGRMYAIIRIGLHHTVRAGRTLYHIFSAESRELFFKLVMNTDTLSWTVEEVADGESN